jgi:tetratricopeptide (TPR) repeat protein
MKKSLLVLSSFVGVLFATQINESFNEHNCSSTVLEEKAVNSIDGSFNNVSNSVINIVNSTLGEKAQKEIVENLSQDIITHFHGIGTNLENIEEDKELHDYLIKQIDLSEQKNISIKEQLSKAQQQREKALIEITKLQDETHNPDYRLVLEEAQKALEHYNEEKYRDILINYRKNEELQEIIKNISNSYYLESQSYYRDIDYSNALSKIKKAVTTHPYLPTKY